MLARATFMGLYVRAEKIAGGDRSAAYSFTDGEVPARTLTIDLDEDRIWPEDGDNGGLFRAAALAIVRAHRREGRLPDVALHQA
jgi:hypothetical protein